MLNKDQILLLGIIISISYTLKKWGLKNPIVHDYTISLEVRLQTESKTQALSPSHAAADYMELLVFEPHSTKTAGFLKTGSMTFTFISP